MVNTIYRYQSRDTSQNLGNGIFHIRNLLVYYYYEAHQHSNSRFFVECPRGLSLRLHTVGMTQFGCKNYHDNVLFLFWRPRSKGDLPACLSKAQECMQHAGCNKVDHRCNNKFDLASNWMWHLSLPLLSRFLICLSK